MMLALELLGLLMIGAVLAPKSALGRWILEPTRRLAGLTPRKALIAALSALLLLAVVFAAPEMLALFGLADLSMFMDVLALSLLLSAGARLVAARDAVVQAPRRVAQWVRVARRGRHRRVRTGRRLRPPSSDDTDGAAWAFA